MAETPGIPEGLPLLEAACGAEGLPFGNGTDFWENLDETVSGFGLAADLDRALAGRSTPRVWVLVHEPGRPQLATAAALAFARALAGRGQAALVLDGDDHATALSRWAGREDAEGWIDIVRYGTSVLTSGVALPFAGRTAYLLGVGSYAPTDVTAEEIDQLLTRLRRQADDLLVVLPGGAQAGAWARRADIRLLCHDQAQLTPPRLAAVVANLAAAGVAPTALVGFGRQTAAAAAPAAADAPTVDAPTVDAPAAGPSAGDAAAEASVAAALSGLEEMDDPGADLDDEGYGRRRGTSPVFWLVAVAATVLIALVGVYYVKFVRVPDGSLFGDAPTAALQAPAATTGTPAAAPAAADTAGPQAAAAADTAGPQDAAAAGGGQVPAQVAAAPEPDAAAPGTQEQDASAQETPARETSAQEPAAPEFDPAPYRMPVGTSGWALQVYSFRDSTSAQAEMDRLARLGLRAAVRLVELPDKGRWYRIYVGSFATRQQARDAEPALFRKLRIDWAQPSRFTVAVTDTAGR